MARIRSASLKQILRKSAAAQDEFVVYRGSIAKTAVRGELLLRPHLSLLREWAVFRAKDVVGKPVPVAPAQRAQRERGHDIVEILVRRGARFRHVQEWLYTAGKFGPPRGIEDHFSVIAGEQRDTIKSGVAELFNASGRTSYGALFHGVVRRGPSPSEITLQPDPGDRREWAAIQIADVIDPKALLRVPRELLPARLHRFELYLVPVRTGAIVRAMWDKERVALIPPEYGPERDDSRRPGPGPIASQGDCSEGAGTCPAPITGSGYPCTSAGSFCRAYGLSPCSGTCKTVSSWVWTCRCDCC